MPMRMRDYPTDWRRVSLGIRERAGWRCEAHRVPSLGPCRARNGEPHPITGSIVVLTVAHLCACRDQDGRKCGVPDHLAALCQRCHLTLDRPHHIAKRRARRHAARAAGDLFPESA